MKKTKSIGSKNRKLKKVLCMNSDPESSKWGIYAPSGGCTEIIKNVDPDAAKVLCWRCTLNSTNANAKVKYINEV